MNLHQFKFVQEAVRSHLNLTEAAKALHTSQPGVSKAILELEQELGIDIFVRHGKRLKRVTEPGQEVLQCIQRILGEVSNLKRIADNYSQQDRGNFSIAATHTQARYVLPEPVAQLRLHYPLVSISMHQGAPAQVAKMVTDEVAEMGMATESLADYPELVTLPCYPWQHMLVMPRGHPLVDQAITLERLAQEPLVTYHPSFTGRSRIDSAFAKAHLTPRIALEAIDSDVIKTYVRLGMGVGIVAEMAMDTRNDPDLVAKPLGDLIGHNVTRVAFKRGAYLRNFVYEFAQMLSPQLTRTAIDAALKQPPAKTP